MSFITVSTMNIRDERAARILNSVHEESAPRPNGLKWFEEYGVWALNKKNAIRKSGKK